jgi:hypothetical protein
MKQNVRDELGTLAEQVMRLRYRAVREVEGKTDYPIWSFAVISDLRAKEDRE